jgi:hypothetical protein
MEELIDLIATDGSPSNVSDAIKQLLYAKSSEKIDSIRPEVASVMFGDSDQEGDNE